MPTITKTTPSTPSGVSRRAALFAGAALVAGLLAPSLAVAGPRAAGWKPRAERRQAMARLADRHGWDMGRASAHTTSKLNWLLGHADGLPSSNVRITDYETWARFAAEAGPHVIGAAFTPHEGGPHFYLVSGEYLDDSIDRDAPRTFDGGKKTRRQALGSAYHFPRIFMLWNAPPDALTLVGQQSAEIISSRADVGFNCAILATRTLGKEGAAHLDSPFKDNRDLMNLSYPVTMSGFGALGRLRPDLVVQVLQRTDLANVQANWEGHEIGFWY